MKTSIRKGKVIKGPNYDTQTLSTFDKVQFRIIQAKISELENGQSGVRISLVLQILNSLNLLVDVTSTHAEAVSNRAHTTSADDLDELDDLANTGLKK